jgi:hypothetical protein
MNFAARLHFRTVPDSDPWKRGFRGGYGWFFGRFSEWGTFRSELESHLAGLGYEQISVEECRAIDGPSDLNEGEQRELFEALSEFPLQYRTLHLYRHDDA